MFYRKKNCGSIEKNLPERRLQDFLNDSSRCGADVILMDEIPGDSILDKV